MHEQIEIVRKTRKYLLELVKDLSLEQLNKIPAGFNNNIVWNLAHLVAAQQGICYKRPGLSLKVEETFFNSYKSGSKPEGIVDAEKIEEIRRLMFSTLDQLEEDYQKKIFTNYPAWTLRYGVELGNIDEVIEFLLFHEGLHMGYVMALKRAI